MGVKRSPGAGFPPSARRRCPFEPASPRTEKDAVDLDTISNLIFSGPLTWTNEAACNGQTSLFFAPAGERPETRVLREGRARCRRRA